MFAFYVAHFQLMQIPIEMNSEWQSSKSSIHSKVFRGHLYFYFQKRRNTPHKDIYRLIYITHNFEFYFSHGIPQYKSWTKSTCHVFHVSEIGMWALFLYAGGRNVFRSWFAALRYLMMVRIFIKSKSNYLYL